jgi:hypothetical protein
MSPLVLLDESDIPLALRTGHKWVAHYPDFEPPSRCSFFLMLRKDFESLDTTGTRTRDLPHFKANTLTITLLIRFVCKVGSDNTNKITTKVTTFEKHYYTLEIVLRDWFSVLNGKLRTENRNVRTIGLTSILDGQVKMCRT